MAKIILQELIFRFYDNIAAADIVNLKSLHRLFH